MKRMNFIKRLLVVICMIAGLLTIMVISVASKTDVMSYDASVLIHKIETGRAEGRNYLEIY